MMFRRRCRNPTKRGRPGLIAKQGLRFWFKNEEVESIADACGLGAKYQVRLPSCQLDRSTFAVACLLDGLFLRFGRPSVIGEMAAGTELDCFTLFTNSPAPTVRAKPGTLCRAIVRRPFRTRETLPVRPGTMNRGQLL